LRQHSAIVDERRQQPVGIELQVVGLAMLAAIAYEMPEHRLVRDPLDIERDADAIGGRAAEVRVELR
jgi:hypothetical protein